MAMLLYVLILILWLFRTGQSAHIGITPIRWTGFGDCLYFLPLLLLPVYNLLESGGTVCDSLTAVLMISVSIAEELFFRGFLLSYLRKWGIKTSVLMAGMIFALFHSINLGGTAMAYTVMQMVCALAIGVYYGIIRVKYDSLLPCAIAHILTNITGASMAKQLNATGMAGLGLCIVMYIFCDAWAIKKIENN